MNTNILKLSNGHEIEMLSRLNWKTYRLIKAGIVGVTTVDAKTKQVRMDESSLVGAQESLIKHMVVKVIKHLFEVPEGLPDTEEITDPVKILAYLDDLDASDGELVYSKLEEAYNKADGDGIDEKKS